jgi:hypothetical protein
MLAMAVIGGIVSAHAPTKLWHKLLYASAFVLLGVIGMYLVIRQSNETAVASSELSHSIHDLSESSKETARVQKLNTELQQRLLVQSSTIESIGKKTISQITGQGTFLYFEVSPNLGSGDPLSFPLSVWIRGKYPMREVTSVIQKAGGFVVNPNLIQPTLPLSKTLLPGVSPVDYRLGLGEYSIQTWCAAGGPINQVIRLKMVDGKLDQQIEVWEGGKQRYKLGDEDLGFSKPKHSSR